MQLYFYGQESESKGEKYLGNYDRMKWEKKLKNKNVGQKERSTKNYSEEKLN